MMDFDSRSRDTSQGNKKFLLRTVAVSATSLDPGAASL